MWLTMCTAVVGYVPEGSFKRWLNNKVSILCFTFLSSALSSVITYHNPENRPIRGICVANHTSPIDVLVLMCDNCYSLVRSRCTPSGMDAFFAQVVFSIDAYDRICFDCHALKNIFKTMLFSLLFHLSVACTIVPHSIRHSGNRTLSNNRFTWSRRVDRSVIHWEKIYLDR